MTAPSGSAMTEKWFRPGEQVPASGVYKVCHVEHRPDHLVTLLEADKFPPCAVCGDRVRFSLDREAKALSQGATP